jgi:hypothetical protein
MKVNPRQEIEKLKKANGNEGYYGLHSNLVVMIEKRLEERALKLSGKIFNGVLTRNERLEYYKIYNMLLDGKSDKAIKDSYK